MTDATDQRPGDAVLGGRVWLEVLDARALSVAGALFQVATGWTVEVTDPWGNTIGFTDYITMPARGRQGTCRNG